MEIDVCDMRYGDMSNYAILISYWVYDLTPATSSALPPMISSSSSRALTRRQPGEVFTNLSPSAMRAWHSSSLSLAYEYEAFTITLLRDRAMMAEAASERMKIIAKKLACYACALCSCGECGGDRVGTEFKVSFSDTRHPLS